MYVNHCTNINYQGTRYCTLKKSNLHTRKSLHVFIIISSFIFLGTTIHHTAHLLRRLSTICLLSLSISTIFLRIVTSICICYALIDDLQQMTVFQGCCNSFFIVQLFVDFTFLIVCTRRYIHTYFKTYG